MQGLNSPNIELYWETQSWVVIVSVGEKIFSAEALCFSFLYKLVDFCGFNIALLKPYDQHLAS